MLATLKQVASLLAGTALLLVGVGLLNTLIPLRGLAAGYSGTLLGGLTSAYYAGYLMGTFAMPRLVRRIGHIRAFAFCTACATCVILLQSFGTAPWAWLALRFLTGVVLVGLYAIIESWLNAQSPTGARGTVFAVYMVVNLGALALGQQLLRIGGAPFLLFAVVALVVGAASLPVLVTRQRQPRHHAIPHLQLRRMFQGTPTAGIGALLSGLAVGAFWGLLPVYAHESGFDTASISVYMSIAIVGGAALQWPLGRLSDRYDRRLTLAMVAVAATLLALAIFGVGHRALLDLVLIFLFGGASFAVYPITVAHLVDYTPPGDLLAASGSVLLVYGVGCALGPLIAGDMMAGIGPAALFLWFAATHAALGGYAVWRWWRVPREATTVPTFHPMLRTTPAALRMLRAAIHARRRAEPHVPPFDKPKDNTA